MGGAASSIRSGDDGNRAFRDADGLDVVAVATRDIGAHAGCGLAVVPLVSGSSLRTLPGRDHAHRSPALGSGTRRGRRRPATARAGPLPDGFIAAVHRMVAASDGSYLHTLAGGNARDGVFVLWEWD